EGGQGVVAGAHDDDAVAGTGQVDQAVAAGFARGQGLGAAACGADAGGDVLAADAAVGGAAVIDGLGHQQDVVRAQQAGEAVDELVLHQPERPEAVRLEQDQKPAVEGVQGLEGGGDLVRVVGEVVDDGDAVRGPDQLHAAADAGEGLQRRDGPVERHAGGAHGGEGGEGVGDVVGAGHGQGDR